jgi:hypothetical protein
MSHNMVLRVIRTACFFICTIAAAGAHAGLLGASATCAITPTPLWTCNTPTATVTDPAEEFRLRLGASDFFGVNITDNSLTLTLISPGGLIMGAGEVADFGGLFSAISVSGFSSVGESGFDLSDVSLNGGTLQLVLNGSSWQSGNSATISFNTREVQVPEPASLALVALALAGMGFSRRKKA